MRNVHEFCETMYFFFFILSLDLVLSDCFPLHIPEFSTLCPVDSLLSYNFKFILPIGSTPLGGRLIYILCSKNKTLARLFKQFHLQVPKPSYFELTHFELDIILPAE